MLFRPSFCANCGEKIERAEWYVWTSRRFCQVCESEYKGHDLIPRFVVGFGVLAAVFGFGSYLRSGPAAESTVVRQPRRLAEQPAAPPQTAAKNTLVTPENSNAPVLGQPEQRNLSSTPGTQIVPRVPVQRSKPDAGEAYYYCGAATKKGTPCSRRVKGNVRCFQHIGMPAMLPAEKSKVN